MVDPLAPKTYPVRLRMPRPSAGAAFLGVGLLNPGYSSHIHLDKACYAAGPDDVTAGHWAFVASTAGTGSGWQAPHRSCIAQQGQHRMHRIAHRSLHVISRAEACGARSALLRFDRKFE